MSAVPAAGAFHNVLAGRPNLEPALTTPWTKFKETTDRDSLKRFAVTCRVAGETGERKGRCAGSWPDRRTEAAKIQGVRTRAQFFGTTKCLGEQGSRLSCRHRARLRLQLARPLQSPFMAETGMPSEFSPPAATGCGVAAKIPRMGEPDSNLPCGIGHYRLASRHPQKRANPRCPARSMFGRAVPLVPPPRPRRAAARSPPSTANSPSLKVAHTAGLVVILHDDRIVVER